MDVFVDVAVRTITTATRKGWDKCEVYWSSFIFIAKLADTGRCERFGGHSITIVMAVKA